MLGRTVLKGCLRAAAVLTCWASLCQAQSENGRFVAKVYIAVLGRQAALHTAGMFPWGIDFNGWDYWTYWQNQGLTRDAIVDTFVGSGEYTNLKSGFITANGYLGCSSTVSVPFQQVDFPITGEANYDKKISLFMLYYYGLNRCPDQAGWNYWLPYYLNHSTEWMFENIVYTNEFDNNTTYYPAPSHKLRIDAFLNAVSSNASAYYTDPLTGLHTVTYMPRATSVTGISNPVAYGAPNVYAINFDDNEGSVEFSQLTTQIGNCQIQFKPGAIAGTGSLYLGGNSADIHVALNGQDVHLSNPYCDINATQSSVSNPGATMILHLWIAFYSGGAWTGQADALSGTVNGPTSVVFTTVIMQPTINSIAPSFGAVGSTVTISGANFGSVQGASTVVFSNNLQGTVANWTPGSIAVIVPNGASSGAITVTIAGLTVTSPTFTVTPQITGISPLTAAPGAQVTISGTAFGAAGTVQFNGAPASVLSWGNSQIVAFVPTAATAGLISVVVNGFVTYYPQPFTPSPPAPVPPSISSLSLSTGPPQMGFQISGLGFGAAGTVTLNGTVLDIVAGAWSDRTIVVHVPSSMPLTPLGQAWPVVVTTSVGSSNSNFTFMVIEPFRCN